jgi:hypothetical protein
LLHPQAFPPLQIFDSRNAALAGTTIVIRAAVSCPSVYDLLVALLVAQWLGHLASSQAVASSNHQNHQLLGNCHPSFLHHQHPVGWTGNTLFIQFRQEMFGVHTPSILHRGAHGWWFTLDINNT